MCVPGCAQAMHAALTRRGFVRGAAASSFTAVAVAGPAAAATPRQFGAVVDLTHTMSPDFPTFFGVPGIEMHKQFDFAKDGFNANQWRIMEHAGTHMDAPVHFSAAGAAVEKIASDTLVVPLAVVDVAARAARDPDYLLSRADLAAWEEKHGRLPAGCCVAMHAGWAKYVDDAAKFVGKDAKGVMHFPGFDPAAADWMIKERQVAGIAVDTLSLDHGASKDFKTHYRWLPSGRWGLENVANLDQVPANGATLVAGVAKVRGATGGPTRIFALV
ncbi:MAG: cyclase family protein [Proteobacteria bacterium]|nr:cyclase family protein [Pseudomonadota bacterium]